MEGLVKKIIAMPQVHKFVDNIFGEYLHAKQVQSLGHGVLGTLYGPRLSSASMGRAMATEREVTPKHAIKQVDRLIGNNKISMIDGLQAFVNYLIAVRRELTVSLDWTEFDRDGHSVIAVNLVTKHGRATPLVWRTVRSNSLKNRRNRYERDVLKLLKELIPLEVNVIVLADRGFANIQFHRYIEEELNWDFVIRMRENVFVATQDGRNFKVRDRVPKNGRIAEYQDALLTKKRALTQAVVCVKKRGMKEAWSLATSLKGKKKRVVKLYARRFTCEENFRDTKDDRFGLGLKETRVSTPERRDRLLLINAIAVILLTLLGSVGEEIGYDKKLRANTAKIRTHSLFRQGREYLRGVIRIYVDKFQERLFALIRSHRLSYATFSVI
jgi:hypothetical protein